MRNPWHVLRCKLGVHRWETVEVSGDTGWKCSSCGEELFEREYLERVYDPDDPGRPVIPHGD